VKHFGVYRIASYLLVLFCLGHTAGGMLGQKSLGPQSDAVFASMKAVHFDFNGGDCTWYGFWFGFGLTASVFLSFSAVAAFCLSRVPPAGWTNVSAIAWALFAAHVVNAALTWAYFFPGAAILATVIAALLGAGAFRGTLRAWTRPAPS
jgi:hypothetical protein